MAEQATTAASFEARQWLGAPKSGATVRRMSQWRALDRQNMIDLHFTHSGRSLAPARFDYPAWPRL